MEREMLVTLHYRDRSTYTINFHRLSQSTHTLTLRHLRDVLVEKTALARNPITHLTASFAEPEPEPDNTIGEVDDPAL